MLFEPKRTLAECNTIMTAPGAMFELEEVEINGLKLRAYKNLPPSVRAFWLAATAFDKRDYIVYEGERWTYSQAHKRVLEIVNLLYHTYGCRKGDRIAIAARNLPEWIQCLWAIQLLGCVVVAVNAWVTPDVMEHCIVSTDCRIVLLDEERARVLKGSVVRLKKAGVEKILVFRALRANLPKGMEAFDECLKMVAGRSDLPDVHVGPEDICAIFFTSGTTGLPKGVLSTQRQVLTNILNSFTPAVRAVLRRGEDIPEPDPNEKQKAWLLGVPLFHATGTHGTLFVGTAVGGKIVMFHKWSTEKAVDLVVKERVTAAGGLPFMAMELVGSALGGKEHFLETVAYGGGPASKDLPGTIDKQLGRGCQPGQGYGSTEVNCAAVNVIGEDYMARPTSTGLPCLVNDVKVVSESGETLPPGKQGEIYIKGINRANGYWKNEEATKEVFLPDGYYRSGDLGYVDEEGFVYILDRAKDIIIRGGENIASVVVENALYEDHRIQDVAVVPIPDARLGELVAAAVVTHPSSHGKVTEAELTEFVRTRLPKHMIPVMIDIRTETLPRNGVGKTMKKELKKELAALWEERQKVSKAKL